MGAEKKFKYEKKIIHIPSCPPRNYHNGEILGYRIVHNSIDNPQNFLPPLIKKPARINSEIYSDTARLCSDYALSFFKSTGQLVAHYKKLERNVKNIRKSLGTHIAEGCIQQSDGVISGISGSGHFELHEYEGTDLRNTFRIIDEVDK